MKHLGEFPGFNLTRGALLGLALTIGAGSAAFIVNPQPTSAAAVAQHSPMYTQFQKYVSNPGTLANARNYLINHIDQLTLDHATVMTLQLENAQKAHLPSFSEKFYPAKVQKAMDAAYRKKGQGSGLTYSYLLANITDPAIRSILTESREKGYKLETSEGMYYPVMHYEGYKYFKSFVQKDIAAYIDIKAAESNRPMTHDAAIVIPWGEVISRALDLEKFVDKYPASNRNKAIREDLELVKSRVFYGSNNTPAYAYDENGNQGRIDPKLRQAYEAAVKNDSGGSELLGTLQKLLNLLNQTSNQFTPEIKKYIEGYLNS